MTRADDPAEIAALRPQVEEAPELAAELLGRFRTHPPVRGVTVTELLDPRAAYWRSVHPVPATAEEESRLREGQQLHERLGRYLVPARAREVRVRRNGVVGRIDVLDDRPVELKSTATPPKPDDDLRTSRPSYLEQLAMYGALTEHAEGRLIVVGSGEVAPNSVRVWDVGFGRLDRIEAEMTLRASALREARERHDPMGLPRCAWFERGCSYRAAGVCGCVGSEPPLPTTILDEVGPPKGNPAEADRIGSWLATATSDAGSFARFRELAYPRRAFFDERRDPAGASEPSKFGTPGDETWSALQAVLEGGPPGELEFRHADSGEPAEAVAVFRNEPCLVKSTRSLRPVPADRVVAERPHYLLELGLRCAALGTTSGYLFTGLERVPSDGPWIHAQRVRFESGEVLRSLLERRERDLTASRISGNPASLPACPRWMYDGCPHRDVCGCAADAGGPGS
ncbi:MAG: hypothetical protein L3K01_04245 [Thermoplasmata archaeon]|nr:hypothetical protein [Thermoplasmata archaeon]